MTPYYEDEAVTLYLGDCREVLPALDVTADCIMADPPYESTRLAWDHWPDGWLEAAGQASRSMWCFLPFRQFAEPPYRGIEFRSAGWKMSQPAVWEKHNGSGFAADRLKQVHEDVHHWYRGRWGTIYHQAPRVFTGIDPKSRIKRSPRKPETDTHHGALTGVHTWTDDGMRIVRSVIRARSMHNRGAVHRTEKPVPLLLPLIEYACPPGGLVVDPFAGSGSTLVTAKMLGRRSVGIEIGERECEIVAWRLSCGALPFDDEVTG